jgi:TusA-related sulfurtransferase
MEGGDFIMATVEELSALDPDKQVDARGTACPGPLLEAKREITSVPVGGIMELLSSDASTKNDVPRWAAKIGHEFLGTIDEPGYSRIFVKRGK